MATAYCSPAELRTQIEKTGTTGSGSDAALQIIIDAVSESIDRYCNRPDGFVASGQATARIYPGSGKSYQLIDDFVQITALAVKDSATDSTYTSWTSSDYIAFTGDPKYPDFNSLPYTGLMTDPNGDYDRFTSGLFSTTPGFRPITGVSRSIPTVQVTARWGYANIVPPVIKQATLALSSRWMKEGQGAWSDTLASADLGQLIYRGENADIRFMLENSRYIRPAIGRW